MEEIISSKIAIMFPGQGSQHPGMGKEFFDNFAESRLILEEASDILGINMKSLVLGDDESLLNMTENTQPALLTVSIAIMKAVQSELKIEPVCVSGHSLGEYTANVFGGTVSFDKALAITRKRGFFMQNACPVGFGKMAAVIGLDENAIREVINKINEDSNSESVFAANFNSQVQTVISGLSAQVDLACAALKEKGAKRVTVLSVSAPFHTPYMEEAKNNLGKFILGEWFKDSEYEILSNATSLNYKKKEDAVRLLLEQITSPVRWSESVTNMEKLFGADTFLEIGPSNVLSSLVKRISKNSTVFSVNSVSGMKELEKYLNNQGNN